MDLRDDEALVTQCGRSVIDINADTTRMHDESAYDYLDKAAALWAWFSL